MSGPDRPVGVVAICAACIGLGAALGFIPGFVATALRDDLGISKGQVGLLVGLHFGCTGVGSILGGRLTERFGARNAVIADMAAVMVAAAFAAAIGSYWSLLVAAAMSGSGYALVNAGTNVAMAHAVSSQRRTLAMSIKTAGVPAMAAITAALGPSIANRLSWQHLLWGVAATAAVAGIAAALVLENDRPEKDRSAPTERLPAGFVWFPIGAFLLIAGSQPLYSWLVAYLEQSLDASPGTAGGISAVASVLGVLAMVLSALRSDRLGADRRIPLIAALLIANAAAIALVLLATQFGLALAVLGAVLGTAVQLSAIGTMHATIVDRAPRAVARATGATMTGYYLGALVSPTAFGIIADATDTFTWSWSITIALLALAIPAWLAAGRVAIVET